MPKRLLTYLLTTYLLSTGTYLLTYWCNAATDKETSAVLYAGARAAPRRALSAHAWLTRNH